MAKLSALEVLDANHNSFVEIPFWIADLKKIKNLSLRGNKLETISHSLSQIKSIERLDLRDNSISEIPSTLSLMSKNLKFLLVSGNPLSRQFLDAENTEQIMKILQQQLDVKLHLDQTMIFALGPGGSGKSSLLKRVLEYGKFTPVPVTDVCTRLTVRYLKHRFSCDIVKPSRSRKATKTLKNKHYTNNREVDFSVWDFESSKIQEGIYESFLQYGFVLLTLDIRTVTRQTLNYWLHSILAATNTPRVLLVFTFVDLWLKTQQKETPEAYCTGLINQFKHLWERFETFEFVTTPSDQTEQMTTIVARILIYLESGEAVSRMVPLKLLQLQTLLKRDAASRLQRREIPICSQNDLLVFGNACGMATMDEIMGCAKVLHSCGSILYFQGVPALKDIVVLRPDWLANIFALLFDSQDTDLPAVLNPSQWLHFLERYPLQQRVYIQYLLERFDLATICLGNEIFVSALLPSTVDQRFKRNEDLFSIERILKFDFLPTRFFNLFLTRVLQNLSGKSKLGTVWVEGLTASVGEDESTVSLTIKRKVNRSDSRRQDLGVQILEKDELTILAEGVNSDHTKRLFCSVLDVLTFLLDSTSLESKSYFRNLRKLVALDAIETHIENNVVNIEHDGASVDLFDVIPDQMVSSYEGPRFSLKDLKLEQILGEGAFAKVRMAYLNEQSVAVKMLLKSSPNISNEKGLLDIDQKSQNQTALSEFRQEIDIQGGLKHPSIVSIIGIILRPFCVIMELCPFGDLYNLIHKEDVPFSPEFRFKVASDIASGLQMMQEQNPPIAHLDLKSPNILLSSLNPESPVCAKIADFGTSQQVLGPILVRKVDNPVWQGEYSLFLY